MRLLLIILLFNVSAQAKVDAYNYDFSLKTFDDFTPDQSFEAIKKKYGSGTEIKTQGKFRIIKYSVTQLRYKFPIFVQFYLGKSVDFYARLPSYFIHNIFHQSLINRLGPQDKFKRYEESASYYWKNAKGFIHYYRAECTITCFPIFYSKVTKKKNIPEYTPILKQMIRRGQWK